MFKVFPLKTSSVFELHCGLCKYCIFGTEIVRFYAGSKPEA